MSPSASPFAKLVLGGVFGQPLTHFVCAHCKEAAHGFIITELEENDGDPAASVVLAYALCARCAALHWERSGWKVFSFLKKVFEEVPPPELNA